MLSLVTGGGYNSEKFDFGEKGLIGKLGGETFEELDNLIQKHFDTLDDKLKAFFVKGLRRVACYGIDIGCIGITGYIFLNSAKAMFFLNKSCKNDITPLAKTYIGYFLLIILRSINAILRFKIEH